MSEYNLKIRRWERDGEVRFYLDGRFVDHRSEQSGAESVYLRANSDGTIGYAHGFRCGPNTIDRAERNAFAAEAVIKSLGLDHITIAEFERRYSDSLTKGGNFSVRQYERKFQLDSAEAA